MVMSRIESPPPRPTMHHNGVLREAKAVNSRHGEAFHPLILEVLESKDRQSERD